MITIIHTRHKHHSKWTQKGFGNHIQCTFAKIQDILILKVLIRTHERLPQLKIKKITSFRSKIRCLNSSLDRNRQYTYLVPDAQAQIWHSSPRWQTWRLPSRGWKLSNSWRSTTKMGSCHAGIIRMWSNCVLVTTEICAVRIKICQACLTYDICWVELASSRQKKSHNRTVQY